VNKEPRLGDEGQAQTTPAEKATLNKEKGALNFIGNTLARKHTRFVELAKEGHTTSLRSDFTDGVLWNNVFYGFGCNAAAPEN